MTTDSISWLRSFLEAHGLVSDVQVMAYNRALVEVLESVVDPRFHVRVQGRMGAPDFLMTFENPELEVGPKSRADGRPLRPLAMLGGGSTSTYSVPLTSAVRVTWGSHTKLLPRVLLGYIPVMVGSRLCNTAGDQPKLELGEEEARRGFFVVHGHAKVVVSQKLRAYNRILRTRTLLTEPEDVTRVLGARWEVALTSWCPRAQTEAFEPESEFALVYDPRKGDIQVRHNSFQSEKSLTVSVVMLAMGHVWTEEEAQQLERDHPCMGVTLAQWRELGLRTAEEALAFVGSRLARGVEATAPMRRELARTLLQEKMLPHCRRGSPLAFVEYMLSELLRCVRAERRGAEAAVAEADDPDFAGEERVRGVGEMFVDQFRAGFFRLTRFVAAQLRDATENAPAMLAHVHGAGALIQPDKVTHAMEAWLANGMISVPRRAAVSGTVDRLNTKNHLASISHMRLITSKSLSRSSAAKQLHKTQAGFKCPYETPDGEKVGVTAYFALGAVLSTSPPDALEPLLWKILAFESAKGETRVVVDGDRWPTLVDFRDALQRLEQARKRAAIPRDTCFHLSRITRELHVRTSAGRIVQAVVRVPLPQSAPFSWDWGTLEELDLVEWMDAARVWDSEPGVVLAASPEFADPKEHTHAHLSAGAVLGVSASMMAYIDRNQAPRNTYGSGMQKQALAARPITETGAPLSEFELYTPHRSIASTDFMEASGLVEVGTGCNAIVLVYGDDDNQDDSAVLNKASVDRGMFHASRPFPATIGVDLAQEEIYTSELVPHGIVKVGDAVRGGSVLVQKRVLGTKKDTSFLLKSTWEGVVESVRVEEESTKRRASSRIITIVIRRKHRPQVGDKMCIGSQKFTISKIEEPQNLPVSVATGHPPDLVVNPNMMPSRMTGATLLELGNAKKACTQGERRTRSTPFLGLEPCFEEPLERFLNPITGHFIENALCVGIGYTHVLGHFATKSFARSRGPRDALTRQPVHGRDRNGGLQFGLQEYACLEAKGCSALVQDRNVWNADATMVGVCSSCSRFTFTKRDGTLAACPRCPSATPRKSVISKHCFLLLANELRAMGIVVSAEA